MQIGEVGRFLFVLEGLRPAIFYYAVFTSDRLHSVCPADRSSDLLEADLDVELGKLLEDAGHVGHPLPDLAGCTPPSQVGQVPAAALALAVDEGDDVLLLLPAVQAAHDELGVVLEVVHLQQGKISYKINCERAELEKFEVE